MSQELEHFFGTSEIDDIDTMFYNFIFQESSEPAPIRLIKKYNTSLSPSLKDKLITFIFCTLEEQLDNTCCDPTILIEPLTQNNDLYYKIVDVLELISKKPESKGLFTYLIYYTSYLISKQRIKRDDLKYYNIFKFLCSLKGNKRIFEDKKVWGLVELPDSIYVRNDAIESFYANQNFERIIIDLKSKAISQIQSDNELYNNAMDYNSIFKYKIKFLPFEAYKQKGIIPCFLEGALVPFFYNRERYCDMLFDKSTADIRNSLDLFIGDIKYIQSNLHSTLFSIIKDNEKARNHFVEYIRVLYRNNRDRRKMMFNEKICITDGVAFNFCNLLDAFCDKIVVKKMFDRIDYNYLDRILDVKDDKKENEIEDENVHKIDENYNVFCTTILTYRILFTELSYIKMFDEKRLILDQMDDFEDERIRKALDSRLNVYRTILFSDFFFQQDSFLEYMVECIIYKDGLDIRNTSLSFNPLFYKILIDFKHHNMVCYYGKISNDVYLIMQRMLLSDINIHEKEKIIRIMYEEKWDITEELFLKLCDIYAQAGKLSLLDRFTIRGYINLIIQNDRNKYIKTLKKNGISFVSGAIQDLEKLLSTGIDAIVNIKKLSITKKEIESKNHKPEENEEYKKIVEKLKDLERQAQGSFGHVDKAFEIVHYILSNNLTLFTYNEVKFLLVNTLNYNLKVLVGPKCSSLSVGNMKKYNFKPREILGLLCTIYSDIRTPNLQEAIVNGKDFNLHFFNRALGIVKERSILNANDLVKFEKFVNQIEGISNQLVEKEEKVYPDEFLDPLTFEVMSNPIKLLTSNVTIDKSTFDLIMVSDGVDPFCREPLDESKYVNDDELKKRIEEFEKQ